MCILGLIHSLGCDVDALLRKFLALEVFPMGGLLLGQFLQGKTRFALPLMQPGTSIWLGHSIDFGVQGQCSQFGQQLGASVERNLGVLLGGIRRWHYLGLGGIAGPESQHIA